MNRNAFNIVALGALFCATQVLAQADSVEESNKKKAAYEAETAAHNAAKARSEAETAEAKARFGSLAEYENAGGVTFDSNAGKMEAQMLASRETARLAREVVDAIAPTLAQSTNKNIVIATSAETVSFEAYDAFKSQISQIEKEWDDAQHTDPIPKQKGVGKAASMAAFSTGLDVLGNLLRSEYKISGLDWTAEDLILARSIVNAAARQGWHFYVPSYNPGAAVKGNAAYDALAKLAPMRIQVVEALAGKRNKAKAQPKMDYSAVIKAHEELIKHIDGLNATLRTPDKDGVVPFAVIVRQAHLAEKARGGHVLAIKSHVGGGTAYSKKNFWTFFGGMPFYVSGGALVSYALLGGSTGEVLAAGVVDGVSPFRKVRDIADTAEKPREKGDAHTTTSP